jgi:hypothetical protein
MAIAAIMAKLAERGIAKKRRNEQQGFKFRGIDDVYNALAPALVDAKLVILPFVQERTVNERVNVRGTALFSVSLTVDYHFVSTVDGSRHVVRSYGEAMDSGDKATSKAMSMAYKYACFQAFCIPTEGDNDPDAATHVVKGRTVQPAPAASPAPAYASWNAQQWHDWESGALQEVEACASEAELTALKRQYGRIYRYAETHHPESASHFRAGVERRAAELKDVFMSA